MKRLVLFLDGTWNQPDDHTSVWRLKLMLARPDWDGVRQLAYYRRGVGTSWNDRLSGGAFGHGLSRNVGHAYRWLMEHYDLGDEIFLFGYSRGAFTARSLAGMIAKCGLLMPEAPISVTDVLRYYRERRVPLYRLEYWDRNPSERPRPLTTEERRWLDHSKRVAIKFIGVFDTVGSLGIPVGNRDARKVGEFAFHHTRLSKTFEHAYQALAIDEHRPAFNAGLWRRFEPEGVGRFDQDIDSESEEKQQFVEQRWFVGNHGNIGGGYPSDPLAQIPLHWMQTKAVEAGLGFRRRVRLQGDEHLGPVPDSYREFLGGWYARLIAGQRLYRVIHAPGERRVTSDGTPGQILTVNESIDETVMRRWEEDDDYRPRNLADHLIRSSASTKDRALGLV